MIRMGQIADRITADCPTIKRVYFSDSVNQVLEEEVERNDEDSPDFPIAWVVFPTLSAGGFEGDQELRTSLNYTIPILLACGTTGEDFTGFEQTSEELIASLHGWQWDRFANNMLYRQGEPRAYTARAAWYVHIFECVHPNELRSL